MSFITLNGEKIQVVDNKLDLRDNHIKEISDIIGLEKFLELKELDLRHNEITEIAGLKNLEKLTRLILGGNRIIRIKGLKVLKNLKILEIWNNKIEGIEGLESLVHLVELNLEYNQINKIQGLNTLKNLKKLSLWHNKISEIEGLENFTNLESLDLSDNKILELKGLGNLNKLKELKMARTRISPMLIQDLGGLNENNKIVNEPEKWKAFCRGEYVKYDGRHYFMINEMLRLEKLGIGDIDEIEGLENLVDLKVLSLIINDITELKGLGTLRTLKILWAGDNKLTNIEGLEDLDQLEELTLNKNQIDEIKGLDSLVNLECLNLNNNQITQMKGLGELSKLKKLYLSDNQKITKIEGLERLEELERLNLENNKIIEIDCINHLKYLKYLTLTKNQISEIKGIENITNLEELNLDNNQIKEIKGLENLCKLREFSIEKNEIPQQFINALTISHSRKDPRWFISYCILKPQIENFLESENGIIYLNELAEEHPILKKIHFQNIGCKSLRNILNLFKGYLEIQENDERKPISIVKPEYLSKELNNLIAPFNPGDKYEYKDINEDLKLHDEESARKLIKYIKKNDLNDVNYKKKGYGIKRSIGHKLIDTGYVQMDEFIYSKLYNKFNSLKLPKKHANDFFRVLNFLVKKMVYGNNYKEFIQDHVENWYEKNKDSSRIEMETKCFQPFMREKLKDEFGEEIIDTPSETRGHIDLKLSFTIPIELKVLKDKKERKKIDKINGLDKLERKYTTQIKSEIINSRVGFLVGLDFRKKIDRDLTTMPNQEYLRFKWLSYPQSKSLIIFLIFLANKKTPSE